MNLDAFERLHDSFGLILSQYGYQANYDSTSQQQRGTNDIIVNPKDVQGWNGFAVVRSVDSLKTLEYEVKSLQMELDVPTPTLDIMDLDE